MTVSINYDLAGDFRRAATAKKSLVGPLAILAQQKETRSIGLLAGVLWRALTNVATHRKVTKLLKLAPFADAADANPRFSFKYLTHDYLVRGFSIAERAACFLHHYRRLHSALPAGFLRRTLQEDVPLLEMRKDGHDFSISMGLSRPYDKEGELSLNLQVNSEIVFVLSFTIVPGWVAKSRAAEILLITRIQGMKGAYRQISLATKALHDVSPEALLLTALHGFASALGIREMASICATMQSSYCETYAGSFLKGYDTFFTDLGVTRNSAGFFTSPLPIPEKPMELIKQGHKIRTKEKRAFKRHVAAAVRQSLRESIARPLPSPAPSAYSSAPELAHRELILDPVLLTH